MSTGYPSTETGIEIEILKSIFSQKEAELFLDLTPFPETPEAAAERLGRAAEELGTRMEDMAQKGQLMRVRTQDKVRYSTVPFVPGIMEFQVKRLAKDRDLARKVEEYGPQGFIRTLQSLKTPHQRAIPVNTNLVVEWPVAPYEDAMAIVRSHERVAVAPCVCRQLSMQTRPKQNHCEKPLETCLLFDRTADYYIENRLGRMITPAEAGEILKKGEEAGLVIQPLNSQDVAGMCSCCGDCCGMLMSLKLQPKPAEAVHSNYYAEVDPEECSACETCLGRCQMEAVEVTDDAAAVLRDRCIGCGLCVTTCPTKAIKLVKKPEDQLYVPPATHMDLFIEMAKERGKL
jgi:NAD-dependent dihydropyrimidine dehydrogenase PreA subunit